MMKQILNQVGLRAAHAVVGGKLTGSRFNMKLGFALLKDRRIGVWPKLLSLAIGGAVAALIIALEIPLEGILALFLPGIGYAIDFVADGMEAVILPVLFGSLILPFVAPRQLVDEIMMERSTPVVTALPPPAST